MALPRVTEVLSILRDPEIEDWYARIGDKAAHAKRRHAERVGITLDRLIKMNLQMVTGTPTIKPLSAVSAEVVNGLHGWAEHVRLMQPRYVLGERLTNDQWGYTGEPDLLETTFPCVTDIKATSRIRPKHWLQLMAYVPLVAGSLEASRHYTVRIVRLDTFLGTAEVKEQPWNPEMFTTFLQLLAVYTQWFSPQQVARA